MTDDTAQPRPDIYTIHASSPFPDDNEALEALVQLKNIDFGDLFSNRETQLDAEEGEGIAITFYNPEGLNSLSLNTTSESNVSINLTLAGDDVENAEAVLKRIKERVGKINVHHIDSFRYIDISFDELELPIKDDTPHQVIGIRIRRDVADYIVQHDTSNSQIYVSMRREFDDGIDFEELDSVGAVDFERIDEFIHEFI